MEQNSQTISSTPASPEQPAGQPSIAAPPMPAKPKSWFLILLIIFIILLSLGTAGFFAYQYVQLKNQVIQTKPTPVTSPSPTPDPTANWKTYTNTAGYSIKYPASFTTQLIAAGAGNKEANAETRNLFIYKSDAPEPYLERYINLEIFQVKPTYNQGTITKTTLDNKTVEKIVIPDAKFDIYSAQLVNKGFIEIYVLSDPTKKEVANQILSTFKFVDQAQADTSNWLSFSSNNGKFIFKYPQGYKINENIVIGVDGVSVPTPNTVQALSPVIEGTNGNISTTITYKNTPSDLPTFITSNTSCSSVVPAKGVTYLIGATNGLIFKNTPCGSRSATYVYVVHDGVGYIVTIESTIDSKTTEKNYDQILSTFKFTQ